MKSGPCIVVVGPPNSGKSSLLNLLDRALQAHHARLLTHVVKGSPDGTARYLREAPELRDKVKPYVKGRWNDHACETIARWIRNARAHVDLTMVDFGGRHAPENRRLLELCTHYLVVAQTFDDPAEEEPNGMGSWVRVCENAGLKPVARLKSIVSGDIQVAVSDGVVIGTFRGDAESGEAVNGPTIGALLQALSRLAVPSEPAYFDLRLERRWRIEDLADLAGRGSELEKRARSGALLRLGGAAPLWVYAAALHRAHDVARTTRIEVFDPKVTDGFVAIPPEIAVMPGPNFVRQLRVAWEATDDSGILHLFISTPDRFLSAADSEPLERVPLPSEPIPRGSLCLSGVAPIWLYLTYLRWLYRQSPGRDLGVYDAGNQGMVYVAGPRAGHFEAREPPIPSVDLTGAAEDGP